MHLMWRMPLRRKASAFPCKLIQPVCTHVHVYDQYVRMCMCATSMYTCACVEDDNYQFFRIGSTSVPKKVTSLKLSVFLGFTYVRAQGGQTNKKYVSAGLYMSGSTPHFMKLAGKRFPFQNAF